MKFAKYCAFALLLTVSSLAFADSPPTLPDGPVASPPGWNCVAHSGVVTCTQTVQHIDP
jgi:hypothetical protein